MPPAPSPDPRGEDRIRGRNMARIQQAATVLFARHGYDGTRMTDVAIQAGLPKANVYYYFPTKEGLYAAVLHSLMEGWAEVIDQLRPDRAPLTAIEGYIRAKLDYSRAYPEESRVFASEILAGAPRLSEADRAFMRGVTHRHAAVLEGWMAEGKIRRVNARHLLISIWAATQYYSDFAILAADALDCGSLRRADYEMAAQTLVATMLTGLRP